MTDGVFGYAVEAREDDGELALPDPSVLRLRVPLASDQVDLGPGGAIVTLAEAARLVPPPTEAGASQSGGGTVPDGDGDGADDVGPDDPDAAATGDRPTARPTRQSRVRLTIDATEDDVHTLHRALAGLRDLVKPGRMKIHVEVDADTGGPDIDKVGFANRVREPLEEDKDVVFKEEWDSR